MNRLRVLRQLRGLHSGRPLQAFPTLTDNASIGGQTPSPLSAPSITDSKINELASKPIHLLTLSDLVKYEYSGSLHPLPITERSQTR